MNRAILLERLKQIVRAAAEFGIDDAGSRVLGGMWPLAKGVLKPIFQELEKRYPALFLAPGPDAAKAAEKAVEALSTDPSLQKDLDERFDELDRNMRDVLKSLAGMDATLQGVGAAVDNVARVQGDQNRQIEALRIEIQQLSLSLKPVHADPVNDLSIAEIYEQANGYQYDAMRWLDAGNAAAAERRIKDARKLGQAGLNREPRNPTMLVTMGYIEKTEAQIAWESAQGDAIPHLRAASTCFGEAFTANPDDVGAMNGLVDVFLFVKDYDRAITLGMLVVQKEPTYGAGALDLSIALEGKIETDPQPGYIAALIAVYKLLETLIPQQPAVFDANHLVYVQTRLEELEGEAGAQAASA
jgi:hypothetical protein